jgi:hypothetical protein
MITLKGLFFGIGLSVFGTIIYLVLYYWWTMRRARLIYPTGVIGFDVTSLRHTFVSPAYLLFVLGLLATGCAVVAMWPRPVIAP